MKQPPKISIDIAPGELIDKITILEIKSARIDNTAKKQNVLHELRLLEGTRATLDRETPELEGLAEELKRINQAIWDIEDEIRRCEAAQEFGERFIDLARSVYMKNDERSRVKRSINQLLGSEIVEEKQYVDYRNPSATFRKYSP